MPVPGTLCSVKSFSDVEHWPEAKLGQVHSNKFQRRLHEQCQSCLHMIGGSLVLVFQRAWAFRVLNCSGFFSFISGLGKDLGEEKKKPHLSQVCEEREMRCAWVCRAEQGLQAAVCV